VLLLALAVTAQLSTPAQEPPALVATTRSGKTIRIDRPKSGPRPYLVEFREAPRARRNTIDRFGRDLGPKGPRIRREFSRAFHGVSVELDDAQAAAIRRMPYVKAVHEDKEVQVFADADTTRLTRIGAERVWSELSVRGNGIDVAVIDTGVDYNHPALAGRYAGGFDFVDGDSDPMDEHGHGTHVAGIVAGTTAEVPGVAPEARLFAVRVLGEGGSGRQSDVVAGIEWAMDPNGDGDYSDRMDVANLSLGGRGDANDPTSQAADRAVAAGVVVVLSAGNTPGGQTIGAPASSRLAITVGSSDPDDALALYSSRGPAHPDFQVKPELVAPGNFIRSAKLGGGTLVLSGTSMAAPHVAGAAALLLSLHPAWTPEDVKAALTATAKPIETDVMSQGAGRIDVFAAARSSAAIAPSVVALGRNGTTGDWTSTRTVRITNRASRTQTFTAAATSVAGATIAIEPNSFTLEPGASREVSISTSIAAAAKPSEITLSHGGRVAFTSEEGVALLPWASVKGALVTVLTPEMPSSVVWSCAGGSAMAGRGSFDRTETLLPHGPCELVASALIAPGEEAVMLQAHVIDRDAEVTLERSHAPHSVRLAGVDEDGKPLGSTGYTPHAPYYAHYLVELEEASSYRGLQIVTFSNTPLRISDMTAGSTLTAGEVLYDFERQRIIGIQHKPAGAIRGDVTLTTLPSDLHHARLEISPRPSNLRGWIAVMHHEGGGAFYSTSHGMSLVHGLNADVYVTEDSSPNAIFSPGVHTEAYPHLPLDMTTLAMRAIGGRIYFSNDRVPAPNAVSVPEGGALIAGEPLTSPRTFLDKRDTAFSVSMFNVGAAGEVRYGRPELDFELRRDGQLLGKGRIEYTISADPGQPGRYQLDVRTQRMTSLSLGFDTSLEDSNPPTLTSFRVENKTLFFSTGDYQIVDNSSRCNELRSTRAFARAPGGEWRELSLATLANDRGSDLGHFETGTFYRASLAEFSGVVEVRVEMEDLSGNTAAATIENVFGMALRQRSVR
jgi:subtilisin family serine protease